jgi:hypothetical protein
MNVHAERNRAQVRVHVAATTLWLSPNLARNGCGFTRAAFYPTRNLTSDEPYAESLSPAQHAR